MAQISYAESMQSFSNGDNQVGFFNLPKDGDEAIVRFMMDDVSDFVILTRHNVGEGKNYRTVNCLRTPHDPVEMCPFCEANVPLRQSFYIYLIQYEYSDSGDVISTPKVWERSTKFATKLKGYIDNYGPLSNMVCKVVRHGTGLNTDYEIIPNLATARYPETSYPKKPELFEGYSVIGRAVMQKDANEMLYYLDNGSFPSNQGNTENEGDKYNESDIPFMMNNIPPQAAQPQAAYVPQAVYQQAPVQGGYYGDNVNLMPPVTNAAPNFPPQPAAPNFAPAPQQMQRPVRRYTTE